MNSSFSPIYINNISIFHPCDLVAIRHMITIKYRLVTPHGKNRKDATWEKSHDHKTTYKPSVENIDIPLQVHVIGLEITMKVVETIFFINVLLFIPGAFKKIYESKV